MTVENTPTIQYRHFALSILFVVYLINFVDRQILAILAEPIRQEFDLSDSHIGFLTGFAFAIFYAAAGLPIGRLADKHNRAHIIAAATAIWSLMTALCGTVANYWQLVLVRIGVGIGEAGCNPPAHSLIADTFPLRERATALSIYSAATPAGVLVGLIAGGWANELFGWRATFMIVGLPGIAIALATYFFLREPRTDVGATNLHARRENAPGCSSVGSALMELRGIRTFVHLSLASALGAFGNIGLLFWAPAYYIRTHDMGTGEVGTWMGILSGLLGGIGTLLGGFLSQRVSRRDIRYFLWVPAAALLLGMPFAIAAFWSQHEGVSLALFAAASLLLPMPIGPVYALLQSLAPAHLRSFAASIYLLVLNIGGIGLGPLFVGVVSDSLAVIAGPRNLTLALTLCSFGFLWATIHLLYASKTLAAELQAR